MNSNPLRAATLALVIGAMLWFSYYSAHPQRAWLFTLALLATLCVALGIWIMKMPLGILVSDLNVMSLSRLQLVAWTIVIFSGYLVVAMQRILHHVPDPLMITVDTNLWEVLGISTASFVGAPLLLSQKTQKSPSTQAVQSAGVALNEDAGQIGQCAHGTLYANVSPSDASITDMFEGDEVGNTAYVDVSKVQMFLLTVIIVAAYCNELYHMLAGFDVSVLNRNFANLNSLPSFSASEVQLLGLSHAGYLSFKAVSHTTSSPQS